MDHELPPQPTQSINPESTAVGAGFDLRLALNGVRQSIVNWRIDRTRKQIDSLDESRFVYAESPDVEVNLVPFQLSNPDVKRRNRRSREVASTKENAPVYRPINPSFTPVKHGERSQAKRAADRVAEARLQRYRHERSLSTAWGKDIGTPEFLERVDSARWTKKEKRDARKAHARYLAHEARAKKLESRVQKSARGEDIPGRIVQFRLERALSRSARLQNNLSKLSAQRAARERVVAAKQEAKRLRSLPPPPDLPIGYDDWDDYFNHRGGPHG